MGKTADTIFSYGFDGWLYWTYNCWEQPDLWNAMESSGTIYKTLAASILGHGATGMITVKPWGTIGPVPSSKSKVTMSYTSGVFDMAGGSVFPVLWRTPRRSFPFSNCRSPHPRRSVLN